MEVRQRVRDIRLEDGWALVKLARVPDKPGIAALIFSPIATAGISVDLILQNASVDRLTDVSFTVRHEDVEGAVRRLEAIQDGVEAAGIETMDGLTKIELVGTGIVSAPAHISGLFSALGEAGVNVIAIGTSEVRISCLIEEKDRKKASKALHAAFRIREA